MSDQHREFPTPINKIAHTKVVATRVGFHSGFTLIELMVVITIIAFLSVIILASLSQARIRAQNAKRLQLVKQYANALELYKSDNGAYPNYGTGIAGNYYCVGESDADSCLGFYTGSTALTNLLKTKYLPGSPGMTDPLSNGASTMHGLGYSICTSGTGSCYGSTIDGYQLTWYMDGINQNCGGGSFKLNIPPFLTECYYP